jgi:hypothetical protein
LVKTTNVFFTIVFKVGLLLYLILATTKMKIDTLIEYKEVVVVCEENGHVTLSYNVLLTTLDANIVAKPIAAIVTTKST